MHHVTFLDENGMLCGEFQKSHYVMCHSENITLFVTQINCHIMSHVKAITNERLLQMNDKAC